MPQYGIKGMPPRKIIGGARITAKIARYLVLNPIPCGGVRSDPPSSFRIMAKNYLSDHLRKFFMCLNNHFTHFKFLKFFLDPSLTPVFGCRNAFSAGGSDLTPLAKSPILTLERSILHFFHSKFNFQQLLYSSYFEKVKF